MSEWRSYVQPPRQGTAHINNQLPCQDAAAVRSTDYSTVLVLADGLGELEKSELASKAVTEAVADFLMQYTCRRNDKEELKIRVLQIAQDALTRQAEAAGIETSEIDCTLMFCIIEYSDKWIYTGQIGDGAICLVSQKSAFVVPALDGPKATSNMTKTLMSSDALEFFQLNKYKTGNVKGVVLCSDGLENEIYSKANGWKKTIEWYANLISSSDDETCRTEIENRWNQLTSDEKYGFSDDMSLAAAFEKNTKFTLPDEVNWLCACGHRNRLESTRCEQCGSDILDVYHGISFKKTKAGNKKNYFKSLNNHPETELKVLSRYSLIPLAKELTSGMIQEASGSNMVSPSEANDPRSVSAEENHTKQAEDDHLHVMKTQPSAQNETVQQPGAAITQSVVYPRAEPHPSAPAPAGSVEPSGVKPVPQKNSERENPFSDRLRNLKSVIMVLVVSVAYSLGVLTAHMLNQKTRSTMTQEAQQLQAELTALQEENEKLTRTNQENAEIISGQKEELKAIDNLPGGYEISVIDSSVYIGETDEDIPDGIGTVFGDDSILTGQYEAGKKNGVFIEQFKDGTVNEYIYENDEPVKHSEHD